VEEVTLDGIIGYLKKAIENREPLPPATFLDAATKLEILLQDLDEELIAARMNVAEKRAAFLLEGKTVALARTLVEADPMYKVYLTLNAKRERINEFVRIMKKRVEIKDWM
jgi:hypothetical protein